MTLVTLLGFALVAVGLWGVLTQRHLVKIIVGFSIVDTGTHLVIVSLGYLKGRTAPILDRAPLRRRCRHPGGGPHSLGPGAHGHRHWPGRDGGVVGLCRAGLS